VLQEGGSSIQGLHVPSLRLRLEHFLGLDFERRSLTVLLASQDRLLYYFYH